MHLGSASVDYMKSGRNEQGACFIAYATAFASNPLCDYLPVYSTKLVPLTIETFGKERTWLSLRG